MPSKDAARTLDRRGRLRSPAAMPGYHKGRTPVTKGQEFSPDPMTVGEIVALLEACKPLRAGRQAELAALRRQALIVVLWRTGIRISEVLALEERDLNERGRALTIRKGKGGRRRISAMDEWGWKEIEPWLEARKALPFGAIFCVLSGPTAGQSMSDSDARRQLRDAAKRAGLRRRANPHNLRHRHAAELREEDADLYTVMHQLGHQSLDTTAKYLRSIAPMEVLDPIGKRGAPMMPLPKIRDM